MSGLVMGGLLGSYYDLELLELLIKQGAKVNCKDHVIYDIDIDIEELTNPPIGHPGVDIFNERNGDDRNWKVDLLVTQLV